MTRTPSPSPAPSDCPTVSPTSTPSASPSATPSAAGSATPTGTPSAASPGCPTASPTPTPTASPTQAAPPATATPRIKKGPPRIRQLLPLPNPQHGPGLSLSVDLEADAEQLAVKVYAKSLALLGQLELRGRFAAGWNHLRLPFDPPSTGTYFAVATARNAEGEASGGAPAKIFYAP